MNLIKSIEIKYLRSIHRLKMKDVGALTVFSGANDVGKSNLLKALNLFFNNHIDWQTPIDFYQDFSLRRLDEVRSESIKGKQFISVTIQFQRPDNYRNSLPPTFSVTKTWLRDSKTPQETNDLGSRNQKGRLPSSEATARRMLSQFLNRIRFEYVPAIRDRSYYAYVLRNLQDTLLSQPMQYDDPVLDAVRELNKEMGKRSEYLRTDFLNSTGIEAEVSLPVDPSALFSAFSVNTKWGASTEEILPLSLRGDGIQARYIPSLLHYIAENSRYYWYIWGFEEPENSIEYNLSIELASRFLDTYSRSAQIFVSSHSPSFISLQGNGVVSYRVYKNDNTTEIAQLYPSENSSVLDRLHEEIGLFKIQTKLHETYLKRREEIERISMEADKLRRELSAMTMPIISVEGKTDEIILKTAWEKLYPDKEMPFLIKSCDPVPNDEKGGAAGAKTLAKLLSIVRSDSQLVIGIFDRDREGVHEYENLPKYFDTDNTLECKISQSKRSVAFLLPIPHLRETYADYENLVIEFYFRDEILERKTAEGRGLTFKYSKKKETRIINGKAVRSKEIVKEDKDFLEGRTVADGKVIFAKEIVPTLSEEEFVNFKLIFHKVDKIIQELEG